MTPFIEVPRDPAYPMRQRAELLAKPPEFFRQFCGGRIPSAEERVRMVEDAVTCATPARVFRNDLYLVLVGGAPPFIRLTIWRHDRQPCENWRHLQQIKNELIGPEHEAAELFPAESRLVDMANEYHLWVHVDPLFRFPFGFEGRCVVEDAPLQAHDSGFARPIAFV
jgi:hypothetical protein